METIAKNKTIYEILFRQKNIFLDAFMILLSVAFLALSAQIRIPLWPVPITMQTFSVFLIAFFFGSRKGALSVITYVIAGILGFAVFSGHKSGLSAITGPTGGYIFGFLACTFVVGFLIEKGYGRTKKSVLACMVIGTVIIYSVGLIGLWRFMGNVGILKILMAGLFPFLIGDAIKIAAAVGLFPYLWKGSEKIGS